MEDETKKLSKEEKKRLKEEKKANKKPIDKMRVMQKVFAILVIIFMIFSVFGTLLFYLLNGNS